LPEKSNDKSKNLQREVHEARKIYRDLDMLDAKDKPFTTFTEKKKFIDLKFENFLHAAEKNRDKYYKSFANGEQCKLVTSSPFVEDMTVDPAAFKKGLKQKIQTLPSSIRNFYLKELKAAKDGDGIQEVSRAVDEEIRDIESKEFTTIMSSF